MKAAVLMLIDNPLNASEYSYPILECLHILGFATAIGTAAVTDFRLFDIMLRRQSSAQISRDTGLLMILGLTVAVFSGLLLFSTDPDKYYLNSSFLVKMIALVLAIVFHYTIFRRVALSGASPVMRKMVACVSLLLWTSVVFGGIYIAVVAADLSVK
jgi:hypothetical protein